MLGLHSQLLLVILVVVGLSTPIALAWHDEGHVYAARAAVQMLPDDVPAFFRGGVDTIAHCSLNADVNRSDALPQLSAANGPEHYLDLELLDGQPVPETRYDYLALLGRLGVEPAKAGFLPYAIVEKTQALTVAFTEHRRLPDNPHVRMRCLVLAGELSHFTADLHMPLHTTVHFDGRVPEGGGEKAHQGIHARVDALPTKVTYDELFPPMLREPLAIVPPDRWMGWTTGQLLSSHELVDRVYELEPGIPALADLELTDEAVIDFTKQQMQASADFTAQMLLAAWRASADHELPNWLDRRVFDDGFDPSTIPPQPAP